MDRYLTPSSMCAATSSEKNLGYLSTRSAGDLVAELPVGADLLEFGEEGVGLLRIERVAELADQVGGEHQPAPRDRRFRAIEAGRKAGQLDRLRDPGRVDLRRVAEPLVGEQLRAVDVVGHQRGVGGAAGKRDFVARLVDDEFGPGVALQHAAHEADVVQEAGANEMGIVFGLDTLCQHAPAKNVAADHRHQHRVFVVVVERVASGDALDGASRERAETLGGFHWPDSPGRKCP